MSELARKPAVATSVLCGVIGRAGVKIRLRACGMATLFDDPLGDLRLKFGDSVLVDIAEDKDAYGETVGATVIGLPSVGVVEIECKAEPQMGVKRMSVRKVRGG